MPQNKINIRYKDLDKLKIKDIELDALYLIKTDNSEYTDVKTGKDLIRIIKGSDKLQNGHKPYNDAFYIGLDPEE